MDLVLSVSFHAKWAYSLLQTEKRLIKDIFCRPHLLSLLLLWSLAAFGPHSSPQRNIQGHWASPQHKPPTSPSQHLLWSCPSARASLMKQWSAPKWGVLSVLKDGYKMTGLMCRVTKTQDSSHVWVASGLCGCICRPSVCGCVCSMCRHAGIQNRTKLVRSRLRGLDRRQEIVWNFLL